MAQYSLQEHLTDSIRRAKQKIYTNTPPLNDNRLEEQEPRLRTQSFRMASSREDKNALAAAMRTLQERIGQLEREKQEILGREGEGEARNRRLERNDKEERELSKLVTALKDKEHEIKKLNRVNSDLSSRNAELYEKIIEMEQELNRCKSTPKQQPQPTPQLPPEAALNQSSKPSPSTELLLSQKERTINELEFKVRELEHRNTVSHETIEKLMRQLEEEKRTNIKWIKLHESQFSQPEQKENSSLEANRDEVRESRAKAAHAVRPASDLKRENALLLKNNKEMYETVQRSRARLSELSRQCKEAEEKYAKLKLIALQIVENVNKITPNPNSHIKYLTLKIMKIESHHLDSLRSYSNHSRRSRLDRSSHSKDRKRSLKMEDLNSSDKKSRQRSGSKSHKKPKINEELLSKSEKKKDRPAEEEQQVEILEKEVQMLKKKYRNLIARAEKDKSIDPEINKKIEETAQEYNGKKERLDEMKKAGAVGVRNGKGAAVKV